jgi:hypothetical protein
MKQVKNTGLEQYSHTTADSWRWRPAAGSDVDALVKLSNEQIRFEVEEIYQIDLIELGRTMLLSIVNQFYNPKKELFSVACDVDTGEIIAYTWADRGHYVPWSSEESIIIRLCQLAPHVSNRSKIFLLAQQLRMWEVWANACGVKIICSTTLREKQGAFLRLHQQAGYDLRGSAAYKRLSTATFAIDQPVSPGTITAHGSYTPSQTYSAPQQPVIVVTGAAPEMEIYQGKTK